MEAFFKQLNFYFIASRIQKSQSSLVSFVTPLAFIEFVISSNYGRISIKTNNDSSLIVFQVLETQLHATLRQFLKWKPN
jgi:hypothetical protein